jgi:hypothetical protein
VSSIAAASRCWHPGPISRPGETRARPGPRRSIRLRAPACAGSPGMSLAHLFTSRSLPGHHSTSHQGDLQPSEGINLAAHLACHHGRAVWRSLRGSRTRHRGGSAHAYRARPLAWPSPSGPQGWQRSPRSTARRRRVPRNGMRSTVEAGGADPDNARRPGPVPVTFRLAIGAPGARRPARPARGAHDPRRVTAGRVLRRGAGHRRDGQRPATMRARARKRARLPQGGRQSLDWQ